jgi:Fe2+ or Zn2+ uptake regulation protein
MKHPVKAKAKEQSDPDDWKRSLRRQSGRVTRSRQSILELLRQKVRPFTPQEIASALGPQLCDLATIYRTLDRFEKLALIQRVDLGDGRARFEIADDQPGGHHHHHLVCRRCSLIVEIEDCIPAGLESRVASHHGFQEVSHKLEFFGLCPKCQRDR